MADWESFVEGLKINLEAIPLPMALKTEEDIQTTARDLTTALQKTIEERIPISKPCLHLKWWWNSNLQVLKRKLNKLSTEAHRQHTMPNHPCHESRKLAAQEYGKAILEATFDRLSGRSLQQEPLDNKPLSKGSHR
jgi:hypothetical protein